MKNFEKEYFEEVLLPSLKKVPFDSKKAIKAIQEKLGFAKSFAVLDYGCGTGSFVKYMVSKGIDAWGVDVSNYSKSLSCVPEKHAVLENNLIPEGFGLKTYDLCFCCGVLQYLEENEIKKLIEYLAGFCSNIWIETLTASSNEIPAKNDALNRNLRTRAWYNKVLSSKYFQLARVAPVYYKNAWLLQKKDK